MSSDLKFGTDGWRGRIAEDYTFENVRRCAHGFARYMLAEGHAGESIVVGHDRRFASEQFAMAASEVLATNGLRVWMTDTATPTPVIAYAVIDKQAVGQQTAEIRKVRPPNVYTGKGIRHRGEQVRLKPGKSARRTEI